MLSTMPPRRNSQNVAPDVPIGSMSGSMPKPKLTTCRLNETVGFAFSEQTELKSGPRYKHHASRYKKDCKSADPDEIKQPVSVCAP